MNPSEWTHFPKSRLVLVCVHAWLIALRRSVVFIMRKKYTLNVHVSLVVMCIRFMHQILILAFFYFKVIN